MKRPTLTGKTGVVKDAATHLEPALGGRGQDVRDAALALFVENGYVGTSMKDIGRRLAMRAPSLYNYVASKHDLLSDVILGTLDQLLANQAAAVAGEEDVAEQLRAATEAHVRYSARYWREVIVTDRDFLSLEEPTRSHVLQLRRRYERGFRSIIERGCDGGRFDVQEPKLASYAIIEVGLSIAQWYRARGPLSIDDVARHHGIFALRIVGADNLPGLPN